MAIVNVKRQEEIYRSRTANYTTKVKKGRNFKEVIEI
jgi:hypothetical protein